MPLIDPTTHLALAIEDQPGVHALLLGSGISRAAGIATGWELLGELITRIAAADGTHVADPHAWWRETRHTEPKYTEVIEALAPSREARQALLKPFFEPTAADREAGRKVPTPAHRAIARLVVADRIRVVVTTNFDRLLEQALAEAGVAATVVSNADGARGALPLQHMGPLVVKVNGDYLDSRILNTTDELAKYPKPIEALLARVFEEYGLIVCAWSSTWDTALRNAVLRATRHRFGTYWMRHGELTTDANSLVEFRKAMPVPIENADAAWVAVESKIQALRESRISPATTIAALASEAKHLVSEPRHFVRLHDLLMNEVRSLVDGAVNFKHSGAEVSDWASDVNALSTMGERVGIVGAVLAMHGVDTHHALLADALQRCWTATSREPMTNVRDLRRVALAWATYGIGVAAVAARRWKLLKRLLIDTPIPQRGSDEDVNVSDLCPLHRLLGVKAAQSLLEPLPPKTRWKLPWSEWGGRRMVDLLEEVVLDRTLLDHAWKEFEYALAISQAIKGDWIPLGTFALSERFGMGDSTRIGTAIRQQAARDGGKQPFIASGFAKDPAELTEAVNRVEAAAQSVRLR